MKLCSIFVSSLFIIVLLSCNVWGMGYDTSEEAEYIQSLWDAGYDVDEIHRLEVEYEKEHHTGWYADDQPTSAHPQSSTQSEKNPSAKKQNNSAETTMPASTSSETYSHDYSSITDEAREAFVAFVSGEIGEDCYINIDASSTDNIITGKELNEIGNKDAKISFVDNGAVKYEWIFNGWKSDDDLAVDLTAQLIKTDEHSYELDFSNSDIGDNKVNFRIQTNLPSTNLYIYTQEGDGLTEETSTITDKDGYLTLNPKDMGKHIVSVTDLLTVEDIFINPVSKEMPENVSSLTASNMTTVKETIALADFDPTDDTPVIDDTSSLPNLVFIFGGVGLVILAITGFAIYKYRR